MLTKRDFQTLATALYEAKMTPKERRLLAEVIADVCLKSNTAFNRDKFYEAAGLTAKHETKKEVK
jgi:hypothetical protein